MPVHKISQGFKRRPSATERSGRSNNAMLLIIDNYNHFTCVLASSAALELPTAKLPRLHSSPC